MRIERARSATHCTAPLSCRLQRFALRLVLGGMAESILTGQRVIPARARAAGFHFRYPEIDIALRGIFEQ